MSHEAHCPTQSEEGWIFSQDADPAASPGAGPATAPDHDRSDPKDKRRFWEHHLAQCRQSSLTQKAYCQKHNLKLHQFYYWKGRLAPDHGKVSFSLLPLPGDFSGQRPSCSVRIVAPNGFAVEVQGPVNLFDLLSMAAKL